MKKGISSTFLHRLETSKIEMGPGHQHHTCLPVDRLTPDDFHQRVAKIVKNNGVAERQLFSELFECGGRSFRLDLSYEKGQSRAQLTELLGGQRYPVVSFSQRDSQNTVAVDEAQEGGADVLASLFE